MQSGLLRIYAFAWCNRIFILTILFKENNVTFNLKLLYKKVVNFMVERMIAILGSCIIIMSRQLFAAYCGHCNDASVTLGSILTGTDTEQLCMYECGTVLQIISTKELLAAPYPALLESWWLSLTLSPSYPLPHCVARISATWSGHMLMGIHNQKRRLNYSIIQNVAIFI